MILGATYRIGHALPNLRWIQGFTAIEGFRLRRYVAHTAILLIVALSALAVL
jgi:hypothetical protein